MNTPVQYLVISNAPAVDGEDNQLSIYCAEKTPEDAIHQANIHASEQTSAVEVFVVPAIYFVAGRLKRAA